MIGKMLGHYQITNQLGKGGMGEVFQAKDQILGRDVAIKVLPEEFARDADRVARFQREAKVLASLNHPNIAAIHGLEQSSGTNFLVLELVEGDTLADRIKRGPIPVEESLKLALQITEALEAAHEKGVIHRDLKPANIKVTADEKVKVLDFGLAKAYAGDKEEVNLSNSPTLSDMATQQGVILGTAAYMSPEQAKGRTVDRRADIWAFGCVLYEMLTGRAAFRGEDVSEILASVIKGDVNLDLLPHNTNLDLRRLVSRCLQKDLKQRYHDIGDLRLDLEQILSGNSQPASAPIARRRTIIWPALCLIAFLSGILIGLPLRKYFLPASRASLVKTTIKVELGHWLSGVNYGESYANPSRTAMALSSDGRFLVYSAIEENPSPGTKAQIFLRKMDQSEAKPIAGTESGSSPFLSPDDKWVGFWAEGKLKKVPVQGGVATSLCDASYLIFGAHWGRNNTIVFSVGKEILRVSADGGEPEILTRPDPKQDESSHRLPFLLPDGKAVLFTIMKHGWDTHPRIALLNLETRKWNVILLDAADAKYVSTGHLVFIRHGVLMAVKFDSAGLRIIGQPLAIVEDIRQIFGNDTGYHTGAGQFSLSETGSLVYATGGVSPMSNNSLVWVDQKGIEEPVSSRQFSCMSPRLSPDGKKIVYVTLGGDSPVWVYDIDKDTNTQLTKEGKAFWPMWNPEGDRVIFGLNKRSEDSLFWQRYDGSMPMERLMTGSAFAESWHSDKKTIAFLKEGKETGIGLLDTQSKSAKQFLNEAVWYPEFSPDGRWIAYTSSVSDRAEVFVQPFPGPGGKYQVSNEGGSEPLWAKDSRHLFFRSGNKVLVVAIQTGGKAGEGLVTTKPRLLFERSGYGNAVPIRGWDLSNDGTRFLMVKREQRKPTPITEMTLVQDWSEELKRLIPSGTK